MARPSVLDLESGTGQTDGQTTAVSALCAHPMGQGIIISSVARFLCGDRSLTFSTCLIFIFFWVWLLVPVADVLCGGLKFEESWSRTPYFSLVLRPHSPPPRRTPWCCERWRCVVNERLCIAAWPVTRGARCCCCTVKLYDGGGDRTGRPARQAGTTHVVWRARVTAACEVYWFPPPAGWLLLVSAGALKAMIFSVPAALSKILLISPV